MTEPPNSVNAPTDASLVSRVLAGFRRITSSGKFIAEIDGLRFIAIASVMMFHIRYYLLGAMHYAYAEPGDSFKRFLEIFGNGSRGVEIFFAISGFILALPFAMQYLRRGRAVSLPQYYLRRVTRLEPPYFLAMILCFLLIWHRRDKIAGYSEYVSSFRASLVYCHNFLWPRDTLPLVNSVAWSLEIEVQFYILAPLIAIIYTLGKNPRRWLLVLAGVAKFCLPAGWQFPHQSLADYFEFFLLGFLLADLYVNHELEIGRREWLRFAGAVISFGSIWICPFKYLVLPIGLFFYCGFKSRVARHLLSNRWVTTIGGMCYSIYLIHWMLITTFGGRILRQFTNSYAVDFTIHTALLTLLILFAGAIYFKLIERPCMSRDWYKRIFIGVKSIVFQSKAIPQGAAGVKSDANGSS
jgi:peptidoglycan/LPS O-acetylase OafA/YrhL